MAQLSAITAIADGELVSPEGTGRKEHLPSSSHQTAATPYSESQGSSGCENTGYWPQIAKMHIEGMISVGPDSCIFPHTEKH